MVRKGPSGLIGQDHACTQVAEPRTMVRRPSMYESAFCSSSRAKHEKAPGLENLKPHADEDGHEGT